MRSMWNGAISFGLVHIPISLYAATEKSDIKFNYLHNECKTPVRYQKHCPTCNRAITQEEIVRGYEYEPGRYVIISEEDLESIPAPTAKTISIMDFVDLIEIDPIYYEKSYYLAPNQGGQKAFALLHKALSDSNKIAIAKVTIRSKEALAAIRVYDKTLVMETMLFPEEVRSTAGLPNIDLNIDVHPNELKMAQSLIDSLAAPFEPQKYTNDYRQELLKMIEGKVVGKEVAVAPTAKEEKVVDLMEALKASIELAKKEAKAKKKPTKSRKKAVGADV